MNWFNNRDFSDAVARGVRKGLQPTATESFMKAYNQAYTVEAGFRAEREAVLQSQYEVILNGVKNGVETPEALVVDSPFHLMIVRFSVLRHPDIYTAVDIESWLNRVRDYKQPKKDSDVPEAILNATNEINDEFASVGYDVDHLMLERERWIEFDEAWSELDDKEQALIEKFGRVFVPKYENVAQLHAAVNAAGPEFILDDMVEPTKHMRKLEKKGLAALATLEGYCEEHDQEYSGVCAVLINPSESLEHAKLMQLIPTNQSTNPTIAGDGWQISVFGWRGECECAATVDYVEPLINALGGERLELPEWLRE